MLSYNKAKEPELFYAITNQQYQSNKRFLEEESQRLVKAGVPLKYIHVIQANRDDPQRNGDFFAYSNQDYLEKALTHTRYKARMVYDPEVYQYACVDLRDREEVRQHIGSCVPDELLDQVLKELDAIEGDKDEYYYDIPVSYIRSVIAYSKDTDQPVPKYIKRYGMNAMTAILSYAYSHNLAIGDFTKLQ